MPRYTVRVKIEATVEVEVESPKVTDGATAQLVAWGEVEDSLRAGLRDHCIYPYEVQKVYTTGAAKRG